MVYFAAAMGPLRSPLFVPGNNPRMLTKALGLAPDAFVPDMEDAVPWSEKEKGRETVASFLPRLIETGIPVIPRVNATGSGLFEQDLEAAVLPGVFGITVGKTASADEIAGIGDAVGRLESQRGIDPGSIALVPWIESAMAVVNAYEICSAPRVAAVAFGAEDLANDMMIERTEGGDEVAYARSAVCIAARAAGVLAVDTPYVRFRDEDGLRRDCAEPPGASDSRASSPSTRPRSMRSTIASVRCRPRSHGPPASWTPSTRPSAQAPARYRSTAAWSTRPWSREPEASSS